MFAFATPGSTGTLPVGIFAANARSFPNRAAINRIAVRRIMRESVIFEPPGAKKPFVSWERREWRTEALWTSRLNRADPIILFQLEDDQARSIGNSVNLLLLRAGHLDP